MVLISVALLALAAAAAWIANPRLVLAALPYLLIIACPLAMMFMVGGMGHGQMSGMAGSEGHHGGAAEETPALAGLSRDEHVRALRQELTRLSWRQEALRQDLEQLEGEQRAERMGSGGR
jgi:hypothetical protein